MIDSFKGDYRWLSNFEMCDVWYEGDCYPSSEHAFQAAKTLVKDERRSIQFADTPGKAKKLGQEVTLQKDWTPEKRIRIMRTILRNKFIYNDHLKQKLLDTGNEELVEGNTWGDTFWGVCNGIGENNLGKLLMEIRDDIKKGKVCA